MTHDAFAQLARFSVINSVTTKREAGEGHSAGEHGFLNPLVFVRPQQSAVLCCCNAPQNNLNHIFSNNGVS
ncbi:hypothetical protein AOLI_G00265690 [Acnodon oligacanthus]